MTSLSKKSEFSKKAKKKQPDISHNQRILSRLKDVTPFQVGTAVSQLCRFFMAMEFREIALNPFTSYPVDYQGETMDVPGVGQLRYNTEPEIWEGRDPSERFFSTSTLFRKENKFNFLRRPAFSIIDFYQPGTPDSMLDIFKGALKALAGAGLIKRLHELPFEHTSYDVTSDGPILSSFEPRWVITTGYDSTHSFFETDAKGNSTRKELFLVTPSGFLEIAALGIVGLNRNPNYLFRKGTNNLPLPVPRLSGMGFGLERLLLAEQILNITTTGSKDEN